MVKLSQLHVPHDEEEWQDSWAQLNKALAKFPWLKPVALERVGGKYDPEKLGRVHAMQNLIFGIL